MEFLSSLLCNIAYIYGPLRWLVSFAWLADALTSMVKIFEILDEEPDIISIPDPENIPISGKVTLREIPLVINLTSLC